jgi:hypothetical protein
VRYCALASLGLVQRDGFVAEQRHIEIPPEVFCSLGKVREGRYEVDSGPKGWRRSINGRTSWEGLYRTRLQELGGCIFPANADPRLKCSSWRDTWKNCSNGGGQLGADCSTQELRGRGTDVYCGLGLGAVVRDGGRGP